MQTYQVSCGKGQVPPKKKLQVHIKEHSEKLDVSNSKYSWDINEVLEYIDLEYTFRDLLEYSFDLNDSLSDIHIKEHSEKLDVSNSKDSWEINDVLEYIELEDTFKDLEQYSFDLNDSLSDINDKLKKCFME